METQDKSSFSIVTASGGGYHFLKEKIRYILPVMVPLVVMYVLLYTFAYYNMDETFDKFQLFFARLPITLYEAWLTCILSRYLILGEDFSKLPSDPAYIEKRRQNMQASIYIFLLFSMVLFLFHHFMMEMVETRALEYAAIIEQAKLDGTKAQDVVLPEGDSFIWLIPFWAFMFWAARLVMLPVYVCLGGGVKQFIRDMAGAMTSIRLMGVWLLSAIPLVALYMLVSQGLYSPDAEPNFFSILLIYLIQAFMWAMFLVVKIGAYNTAMQEIYQNR